MSFGAKVKEARQAAGMSVAQLARACGVTENAIRLWEKDLRKNPRWRNARAVATALNLPIEHFIPDDEEDQGEPAADKAVHR